MPLYSGIWTLSQASQAAKSGTWTGIAPPVVEYLVVAGGGGGSSGGGGAGGLLQGNAGVAAGSLYYVTVGGGGNAGYCDVGAGSIGTNGSNSVFDATSSGASTGRIVAIGGGAGGQAGGTVTGQSGGSGGGGAANGASTSVAGSGTSGQGNAGGSSGGFTSSPYGVGGGGGAGTVGISAASALAYGGGSGIASDITGIRTAYAGGGGGGSYTSAGTGGPGGAGGGGNGSAFGSNTSTTGGTNTGGGGGGGRSSNLGSAGGSGIVVVRYPDYYTAPSATTGTPTAATIGPASLNFGGSSSLSVASNAAFAYGTGDFTWEAWIYPTSASWTTGNFYIFDHGSNGGTLQYNSNLKYYNSTTGIGSSLYTTTAATITPMQWTHIAVARASGTTRLFINGNLLTSASDLNNYAAQAVTVGNYGGGGNFFSGYMTNIRIIKGAAAYTASFALPTQQLTAVTGTSLLLNANYWAPLTDSSSNGFSIGASGSVPIFNSSPYNWIGSGAGYRVYTWTTSGSVTF